MGLYTQDSCLMEDGDVRGKEECEAKIYENIMPLIQNTIVLSDIKLTLRFC